MGNKEQEKEKYYRKCTEGLNEEQLELFDTINKNHSCSYGVCELIVKQAHPADIRQAMRNQPDDVWGYLKALYNP